MSTASQRRTTPSSCYLLRERPNGGWAVTGPQDRCGGLFADRRSAERFIREEHRARAAIGADTPAATVEVLVETRPAARRPAHLTLV